MTQQNEMMSVSRGRSLFIWGLLCALAGVVFLTYYAASSAAAGSSVPVMPLDDAYIHFQYARVLAEGYPYQYNPGLPPTSGATSFIYPYILAFGYFIGFKGLALAIWATTVGAIALALTAWIVCRFALLVRAPFWLAVVAAVGFELNGAITWHYMSGMETGLTILFTLYTIDALTRENYRQSMLGATLAALIRPEGALIVALVVAATLWRERRRMIARLRYPTENNPVGAQHAAPSTITDQQPAAYTPMRKAFLRRLRRPERAWLWMLLPIIAITIQPLFNLLLTGSPVASGNAAKSLLGIIPFDTGVIGGRIWENFRRMWWEFVSPTSVVIVGGATMMLAGFGLAALAEKLKQRVLATLLLLLLLLGTAAISTLDTAFWHFKRYQMPYIAILLMLAVAGVTLTRLPSRLWKQVANGLFLLMTAAYLLTLPLFVVYYALNVGYVAAQPLQMANWINANTASDAVIAVHDTGSLRYIGNRTTLDMVGLTTPGAAESWRNGPGAVAEFLERQRPDYIASYGEGHGYGLGYLQDTGLYAEMLAQYTVELDPEHNVALAASTQGIYHPQWEAADRAYDPVMLPQITRYLAGMEVYDELDVADIYSEYIHNYQWVNDESPDGFPTEVYQFGYIGCTLGDACTVMDGGRRINGDERFTLNARAGQDLVLVTRLHPANSGNFDVFANDILIDNRIVPAIPGGWLEVATLIPGELVTEKTRIHIVPRSAGNFYMPYQHWAFQGNPYAATELSGDPISTFQNGAIGVYDYGSTIETHDDGTQSLVVSWLWETDGSAQGDYKIFVHVLDADGANAAQADIRPGSGTLPPGNWLPGSFRETITIDISELPPGTYQIALGLYDAVSGETLMPTGGDEFGRLMVDSIVIE